MVKPVMKCARDLLELATVTCKRPLRQISSSQVRFSKQVILVEAMGHSETMREVPSPPGGRVMIAIHLHLGVRESQAARKMIVAFTHQFVFVKVTFL